MKVGRQIIDEDLEAPWHEIHSPMNASLELKIREPIVTLNSLVILRYESNASTGTGSGLDAASPNSFMERPGMYGS